MTTAGDEECGTRTARVFLQKHVFLVRGQHFAAELKKSSKIDCQSPRAKLGIGELRSAVLTSRRMRRHYPALAQKAKRALKQVNGVLLHAHRGGF